MMMGFGFLWMLLFWGALLALLAGGAVLVFRQSAGAHLFGGQRQPTARQILDERFARGEINREEYDAMRLRLEG